MWLYVVVFVFDYCLGKRKYLKIYIEIIMLIEIICFVNELILEKMVLFFGVGVCVFLYVFLVVKLMECFEVIFNLVSDGYLFCEYIGIIENKYGCRKLIEVFWVLFKKLYFIGSFLNMLLYLWKFLFIMNYDFLIE